MGKLGSRSIIKMLAGDPETIFSDIKNPPTITELLGEKSKGQKAAEAAAAAAEAPTVEPPPPMPMPDDESAQAARRRSIAAQRSRRGRVSTIFTQPEGQGLGG